MTDDIQREPISHGQTIWIMATLICNQINAMVENVAEPDRKKLAQCYFSIFVHDLASFSKEPAMMAKLLHIVAEEMEAKANATP